MRRWALLAVAMLIRRLSALRAMLDHTAGGDGAGEEARAAWLADLDRRGIALESFRQGDAGGETVFAPPGRAPGAVAARRLIPAPAVRPMPAARPLLAAPAARPTAAGQRRWHPVPRPIKGRPEGAPTSAPLPGAAPKPREMQSGYHEPQGDHLAYLRAVNIPAAPGVTTAGRSRTSAAVSAMGRLAPAPGSPPPGVAGGGMVTATSRSPARVAASRPEPGRAPKVTPTQIAPASTHPPAARERRPSHPLAQPAQTAGGPAAKIDTPAAAAATPWPRTAPEAEGGRAPIPAARPAEVRAAPPPPGPPPVPARERRDELGEALRRRLDRAARSHLWAE